MQTELRGLNLNKTDLVVAVPAWVDVALEELQIPVPAPPDYPLCLSHLLRRRVWKSTLGEVQAAVLAASRQKIFVKPAEGAKGFSGTVMNGPVDDMLELLLDNNVFPSLGPQIEVHCSEVVDMNSEYAVYVVDGAIRAICHYMCKKSTCRCPHGEPAVVAGKPVVQLDMAVVNEAVRLLAASAETKKLTGYRADFALVPKSKAGEQEVWETALVEVNDGYVSGRYEGMAPKDFVDMLVSRFASLQSTAR